ncbi:polysaccharide biosynthesis/export family protein [Ideonella sp. DXS22W]|uniref:Polysaccharide biosynthesis/export family protein n=1 Tax=Pseudaquabacterium inlustre TaxID=2984192 RepID=A0ABU9CKR8_9BURK
MKPLCPLLALALLAAGCSTAPRYQTERGLPDLLAQTTASAPAQSANTLPRLPASAPRPAYRLGAGDELAVTVWGPREVWQDVVPQGGNPSRSQVTVQDDGAIVLPLVRRVAVAGLTVTEALQRIGEAYRGVAGARFQVDAALARARPQTVLVEGAVVRPGQVTLAPEGSTLGEAVVGAAGGLTEAANPARGVLFRGGDQYALDWDTAQQGGSDLHRVALQPADRIYFPPRRVGVVYVFGEVSNPGLYPIPTQGLTVLQALAQAKGPLVPQADQRALVLLRAGDAAEPAIYRFSLEEALAAPEIALLPGDRLFVPATGLTDWERTLRQAVPIFGVIPR